MAVEIFGARAIQMFVLMVLFAAAGVFSYRKSISVNTYANGLRRRSLDQDIGWMLVTAVFAILSAISLVGFSDYLTVYLSN